MLPKTKSRKIIAGRYAYEKPLGKGAGGAIYLAEDLLSDSHKMVALKIISAEAAATIQGKMLRREFEILSKLDHRNLVRIYDFGSLPGGGLYLTEEFIHGFSLQDARALLDPQQMIDVTLQILEGLAYMHGRGMVHRDIKPANIMILWPDDPNAKPLIKLVDFGLSSLNTDEDTLRGGTRSYMAPEVVRGEKAVFQSDLYSLGVTLYYAMCGVIPFGPRTKDDPPTSEESFRPPEPHRINPLVPLSLSRFTMVLLRQVPGLDVYDGGQALRMLVQDVFDDQHSHLENFDVDIASSVILKAVIEKGLTGYREERRINAFFSDHVGDDEGRMVIFSGHAGVGKSRLMHALSAAYKLNNYLVIEVRKKFYRRPYGMTTDVILQLIGLILSSNSKVANSVFYFLGVLVHIVQALPKEERDRFITSKEITQRLFLSFTYLLSFYKDRRVVFLMDDIHQANVNFARLAELYNNVPSFPKTTIILAGEPGEAVDTVSQIMHAERIDLKGYEREDLQHFISEGLKLPFLSKDRIDDFFTNADNHVDLIYESAFLCVEDKLLKVGAEGNWHVDLDGGQNYGIPLHLSDAIARRLNNLSPITRTVLEILSLVRGRIDRTVIKLIIEELDMQANAEDILRNLMIRHYVTFDFGPDGYFLFISNRSLQNTIRDQIPLDVRQRYHSIIAKQMASNLSFSPVDPIEIAYHFENASEALNWRAAPYYKEAADRMSRESDGQDGRFIIDAIECYQKASTIVLAEHVAPQNFVLIQKKIADCLIKVGKLGEARKLIQEAWEFICLSEDISTFLKYCIIVTGMQLEQAADSPQLLTAWERRLITDAPQFIYSPKVSLIRAWHQSYLGNFNMALELVKRAKIRAELFQTSEVFEADAVFGLLYEQLGQIQLAYRHYESARELAELQNHHPVLAIASLGMARIFLTSNQLSDAQNLNFEGYQYAMSCGRPDLCVQGLLTEARILALQDNGPDARLRLQDAARVAKLIQNRELQGRIIIEQTMLKPSEDALIVLEQLIEKAKASPSHSLQFYIQLQKIYGRRLIEVGDENGQTLLDNAVNVEQGLLDRVPGSSHSGKLILFPILPYDLS